MDTRIYRYDRISTFDTWRLSFSVSMKLTKGCQGVETGTTCSTTQATLAIYIESSIFRCFDSIRYPR